MWCMLLQRHPAGAAWLGTHQSTAFYCTLPCNNPSGVVVITLATCLEYFCGPSATTLPPPHPTPNPTTTPTPTPKHHTHSHPHPPHHTPRQSCWLASAAWDAANV